MKTSLQYLKKEVSKQMKSFSADDPVIQYFMSKMDPETKRIALNQHIPEQHPYRHSLYHIWLNSLMKVLTPSVVVELGAHQGISDCMMLAGMPDQSTLISVDIVADSWSVVPYDSRIRKIVGDDLDLGIYPLDVLELMKQADVWFIDSNHTEEQLTKEHELYSPLWKKGAVILVDDVSEKGEFTLWKAWEKLPYEKMEFPDLHYTGWGVFIV